MRKLLLVPTFAVLCAAIYAAAQTPQNDVLLKHWKTSGEFTLAVADAMAQPGSWPSQAPMVSAPEWRGTSIAGTA